MERKAATDRETVETESATRRTAKRASSARTRNRAASPRMQTLSTKSLKVTGLKMVIVPWVSIIV